MEKPEDIKKCCTPEDTNREGTSRLTRFLKMLDPANAPIDPRNTEDILVFAKRYAELVRYYDFTDTVDCIETENEIIVSKDTAGEENKNEQQYAAPEQKKLPEKISSAKKQHINTWKEFFYNDIAVIAASISQYENKLLHIKKEYNDIRKEIESNPSKENYRKLFLSIIHHLKRIQRWHAHSVDGHPLKSELEVNIKSFLVPALKKLIAYDKGMQVNTQDDLDLISQYESFKDQTWKCDYNKIDLDPTIYVGDHLKKKIIYALMYVDDIFNTMYKVYEEITKRSSYYWQQAIENYPSHQPHMALFISFVELFSYAKNELNSLTKRHLEFFYRDVLHLKEKPANPDSVYLIYQLAKGVEEFDLKEGTELTAGKDALGIQQIYKTDKELVINTAKVKELKTVFLDKINPIKNIYAAPVANSADGKGEKFKEEETAWSTFGYFEPREEGKEITGEKAQFGFAFATPQLNLGQSERIIDIKIFFKNNKTEIIPATKTKPEKEIQKRIRVSRNDFEIYFTGEKEWVQPVVETETEEFQFEHSKKKIAVPVIYKERLFSFLNSPDLTAAKLAPKEHSLGPIFDDASFGLKDGFDDDDIGNKSKINKEVAESLFKGKPWSSLDDLKNIDWLGDDKINDLIYSFSNKIVVADNKDHVLFFRTRIQTKQEAISAPGKDFKDFNFKTGNPVCKIVFNQVSEIYEALKDIVVTHVEIAVDVKGLTDIIIENDDGAVDPKKDFFPFSAKPVIGSNVMFGAKEFENKNIESFTANVEWKGNFNFTDRYLGYVNLEKNPTSAKNHYQESASYRGIVKIFDRSKWITSSDKNNSGKTASKKGSGDPQNVQLFGSDSGGTATWNILPFEIDDQKKYYSRAVANNNYGLIKLALYPFDFGHDLYPTLIAQYLAKRKKIANDDNKTIGDCAADAHDIFVPSTPAEVQIKSITFDYHSLQTLHPSNSQFFHICPFGQTEIFYEPENDFPATYDEIIFDKLLEKEKSTDQLIIPARYLLPQFKFGTGEEGKEIIKLKQLNNLVVAHHKEFLSKNYFQLNQYVSFEQQQGNLYIGIENLNPPQNLSLLFKFADGSAYDNDNEPPKIHWSYLVNNEWLQLPQDRVISDSTYGFQTTGIILIDFPADATKNNSIVTNGLHWLCAGIDENGDRIPKLIDVIAQANQATFYDQQNDPVHYNNPLPEKSISKPLVKIPEVKVIEQPFESFDGKPREEGNQFYQRVSERLRHKGRAITPWDYEHLVLEQFPSVYKVKILSHTDPECLCRHEHDDIPPQKDDCCCPQVAPGHVLVIPVSNLRNKNAIDILKPRTGRRTLLKIEEFLTKRVSPFVHIHAKNPKFEEVKVSFNVKFYTGIDKGFYKRKLNDDLVHYLTPWAYDSNFEILFGNTIYASKIINFIEELEYVDYITCFRMVHIMEGCCSDDSLANLDCDEMKTDLTDLKKKIENPGTSAEDKENYKKLLTRFINEISATSSQAILVSAKQHCINLIEEEPVNDDCNCNKVTVKKSSVIGKSK